MTGSEINIRMPNGLRRFICIFTAWAFGWTVYMIAMVLTVYDGILSLIFQPIMATVFSAVFVGAGLLFGLIFRIPPIGNFWHSSWLWAASLVLVSIFLLCFGYSLGLRETITDPETGGSIINLRSDVFFGCYFILLFAIANWPLKRRQDAPLI